MSELQYSEVLQQLHRIHRQLTDLRGRLARGPQRVKAVRDKLAACEARVAQIKESIKATKLIVDRKQLQLRESEAKIETTQGKLNAANSNEEFQIFKEQIAAAEMANSVLSDEILEAMEKVDQLEVTLAEANDVVKSTGGEVRQVESEVEAQKQQLEGEVARLYQELEGVEQNLPRDIKADYQRVVKARGEEGLAAIDNGCCGQCNVQLRIQTLSDVKMGKPLFCSSCGALLYLNE